MQAASTAEAACRRRVSPALKGGYTALAENKQAILPSFRGQNDTIKAKPG